MRLLPVIILEIENIFKKPVAISLYNVKHVSWLHLASYDEVLQARYKLKIEFINFQAEFREDFSNPELDGWENETLLFSDSPDRKKFLTKKWVQGKDKIQNTTIKHDFGVKIK